MSDSRLDDFARRMDGALDTLKREFAALSESKGALAGFLRAGANGCAGSHQQRGSEPLTRAHKNGKLHFRSAYAPSIFRYTTHSAWR